jgi:hypothetical protein
MTKPSFVSPLTQAMPTKCFLALLNAINPAHLLRPYDGSDLLVLKSSTNTSPTGGHRR